MMSFVGLGAEAQLSKAHYERLKDDVPAVWWMDHVAAFLLTVVCRLLRCVKDAMKKCIACCCPCCPCCRS